MPHLKGQAMIYKTLHRKTKDPITQTLLITEGELRKG